jgi:dTDP-4-amino-4,6-dideoxygalactose transaminase
MNMPDICAAIGLAQLRKYPDVILPARRRVFDAYRSILGRYPWVTLPPSAEERTSSCHVFALRIRDISEQQRDAIIDQIALTGVSVNVHFQPLPLLTVFRNRGYDIIDYPIAYDNYAREISLPVYPELDEKMIAYVTDAVVNAYQSVMASHA